MGILQALFGGQMGQQGMQSGFTPVNQMPQTQQQQAPQTLGLVQDILSQRFQPQGQDTANAIFANGTGLGTNGGVVTPEQMTTQRLAPVLDIAKTLGTLNQSQLEIAKLNEQMRHDRVTEGQALANKTLSVGPPSLSIPTMMQNNSSLGPQSSNDNPSVRSIPQVMAGLATTESGNDPNALSSAGAAGKFQIMPDTARNPGFGVQPLQGWDGVDPRTAPPQEQQRFATDYLTAMTAHNGGNLPQGLMAYNGGPGTVDNWKSGNGSLPAETQAYPGKVMGNTTTTMTYDPAAYQMNGQQAQPAGNGFMPIFKGGDVLKDGLSPDFAYVPNPSGGIKAQQIPGTVLQGKGGEVLTADPETGVVTQTIPKNPVAQKQFEANIQKIAGLFDQLHKDGGSIEVGGSTFDNKLNQLEGTQGLEIGETKVLPGGQNIMQGSKTQAIRDEIQGLIKQTTPLYMQAMGITPGMERAQAAQQMLQDALGGSVMKSRQANQYSLANLSQQAGTGEYSSKFNTLKAAQDAIAKGAPKDAVAQRLKAAGIDPADIE